MGLDVSLIVAVGVSIETSALSDFETVEIFDSCLTESCKNNGKKIDSKFCSECGCPIEEYPLIKKGKNCFVDYLKETDFDIILDGNNELVISNYNSGLSSIDVLENGCHSYINLSDFGQPNIDNFISQNTEFLEKLKENNIKHDVKIITYTSVG